MKTEIKSVFTVDDFKDKKTYEITVDGFGQKVMRSVRNSVSKFSKIVLDGFEINGKFVPLSLRTNNTTR